MYRQSASCCAHARLESRWFALVLAFGLVGCNGGDNGTEPGPGPTLSYTVIAHAGDGGSIAPSSRSVIAGTSAEFTVAADAGYRLGQITGCDGSLSGEVYTTAPIMDDCTISVGFVADPPPVVMHQVSTSAGAGGSIAPTGVSVADGESASFTVTADNGYRIDDVDGCSGHLVGTTYTTAPVTVDCTVSATFAVVPPPAVTHIVTASAGSGGSIAPTRRSVADGASTTFTVTADAGFHIAAVSGCGGSLSGTTYTTGPITANCAVTASFAEDTPVAAARPLNDTGIVYCARTTNVDGDNRVACDDAAAPTPVQQDAMQGRDYAAVLGTLTKVGGSTPNAGVRDNGFDFTKLDGNGEPLPADAQFWRCVRDNVTGLEWENKTDNDDPNVPPEAGISDLDPGPHDKDWTYSWFDGDSTRNGGAAGTENSGVCAPSGQCDTAKFVATVNARGLCGHTDWRLPTVDELQGIADRGRQFGTRPENSMAIDPGYFSHTQSFQRSSYWSASPSPASDSAWVVNFYDGSRARDVKSRSYAVRLVRDPASAP